MTSPENTTPILRRKFLQTSATIAGTAIAGAPYVAAQKPNTQTLKLGLIGCGGRGTGAASNALKADDGIALTAMGDLFDDSIEKSLANLRKQLPDQVKVEATRQFTGFDAFEKVIDSDVDVVILATPPAFRPLHLREAVEAGKHTFVEITAAIDAPGVRSVLKSAEMARAKNLSIVSGFVWRYDPALRAAKEQIQSGAIGEIRAVHATYYRANLGYKFKGIRPAGMSDLEFQFRDWYKHLWLSGDVTILLSGGHSVDKMSWWLDDEMPVNAVAVGSQIFPNWGNTFDNAFVTYEYANGIPGFLGSRSQSGCFNETLDQVIGTKGIFKFSGRIPVIEGETKWQYRTRRGSAPRSMYQVEHDELIASIRTGKAINDGTRMAHTTLMALMGRMAAYTGQKITWEQAMNSKQKLVPDQMDWDTKIDEIPLAIPGETKFV